MENSEIADILEQAADYMQIHGKCVDVYEDEPGGSVCSMGAIARVLDKDAILEDEDIDRQVINGESRLAKTVHLLAARVPFKLDPDAFSHPYLRKPGRIAHDTVAKWSDANDEATVIDAIKMIAKDLRNGETA